MPVLTQNTQPPAGMMTAYTKSLRQLTAITATAINTTANILSTGLLSSTLLSKPLSLRWILGSFCLIMGTLLLTAAAQPEPVPQLVPLDLSSLRPRKKTCPLALAQPQAQAQAHKQMPQDEKKQR